MTSWAFVRKVKLVLSSLTSGAAEQRIDSFRGLFPSKNTMQRWNCECGAAWHIVSHSPDREYATRRVERFAGLSSALPNMKRESRGLRHLGDA
jgi:hypothetical protein